MPWRCLKAREAYIKQAKGQHIDGWKMIQGNIMMGVMGLQEAPKSNIKQDRLTELYRVEVSFYFIVPLCRYYLRTDFFRWNMEQEGCISRFVWLLDLLKSILRISRPILWYIVKPKGPSNVVWKDNFWPPKYWTYSIGSHKEQVDSG